MMKNIIVFAVSLIFIIVAGIFIVIKGDWKFEIQFIDFLSLLVTIALAVIVYVYTLSNEKKNLSCDLIAEDLKELCSIYASNSSILSELELPDAKLNDIQAKIRFNFHKADCLIDTINAELKESFPSFQKEHNLADITKGYTNWLTGGELMEEGFTVSKNFIKNNETQATTTVRELRLLIHKLVKL